MYRIFIVMLFGIIMLIVIKLSFMPFVIMLILIKLSVVMLTATKLSVILLIVVMPIVNNLSVVCGFSWGR
jgi:hypothetical protein